VEQGAAIASATHRRRGRYLQLPRRALQAVVQPEPA